jgi:hypothetical protein
MDKFGPFVEGRMTFAGWSGTHSIGVKLCRAIEWPNFGHFALLIEEE